VGSGPFPTELLNELGESLREYGAEYGATTGRPRRCGWLDLPVLKYSIMLSGVTELMMTKSDVLTHFDTLKVCTGYRIKGELTEELPFDIDTPMEPVYEELPSWSVDLTGITEKKDLPGELLDYVAFVEARAGVPITYVSVGPDREQIIKM
jgi:adenylosuccinate synthase